MAYENFMSQMEDVIWLAYKLKFQLGSKISINQIGLYKEILEGKYHLKGCNRGIDFTILYSDKEFLRISVGEVNASTRYEDKLFVLNELKNAISSITRNGVSLGEPSVFYNVIDEQYKVPHLEYIYADKENYIKSFKDKTIFDDAIPEDVIVFDYLQEGRDVLIFEDYSYVENDNKYIMEIRARLKNKSNIENQKLRALLIDNLEQLCYCDYHHNRDTLLSEYADYNCDIRYIVDAIRDALSLTQESELLITITKNNNIKYFVSYKDGILLEYKSSVNSGVLEIDTSYNYDGGISFKTNCGVKKGYEFIKKHVSEELHRINELVNGNYKCMGKSNNNLLKLVRKMDNK